MSAIELYARPSADFDAKAGAHARRCCSAAASEHAGRIVQATSLGAEDMVITDLIARHRLPIAIGTLETGMLHGETLALIARIEQRYGLHGRASTGRVDEAVVALRRAATASEAMYQSIELRKACCGIRKLEPLARMLAGRTRLGHRPAPRAVERPRRRCRSASIDDARPRQVQPAGRLELGRRLALHRRATTCPTTRCTTEFYPEHRLRAVHARHRRRRRLPRRPLVVGRRERQGMRPARRTTPRRIDDRSPRMNAPPTHRPAAARARPRAPRRARGRSDLHPARGRRRLRAPGAAVLRRQGFVRRAAPGREGVQDARAATATSSGRLPFPLLHVDTGHNFPEVIEFRDRRVAEMGERLVVGHLEDSITRGTRAPGAPAANRATATRP